MAVWNLLLLAFISCMTRAFSWSLQAALLHAGCEGPMLFQGVSHKLGCLTSCDWLCVRCRQRTARYSFTHISTHEEANHSATAGWRPSRPGWWRALSAPSKWLREAQCWQEERPQEPPQPGSGQDQTTDAESIPAEEEPVQPLCGKVGAGWRCTLLRLPGAESSPSAQTVPHREPAGSRSQRRSFPWAQPEELPGV